MNRILFIDSNRSQSWIDSLKVQGIDYINPYRDLGLYRKLGRELNRIAFKKLGTAIHPYWFNPSLLKEINKYDLVVVFLQKNSYDLISYLHRINSGVRIILWYWNPVFRVINPNEIRRYGFELWSFDKDDCLKYNLNYNTTFYAYSSVTNLDIGYECDTDFVFLGANKGRLQCLNLLENRLVSKRFNTLFYIVDEEDKSSKKKPNISYEEYLSWVKRSKCIVDFYQRGQSGLTLRVMESLYYKRKLLTNYQEIINSDFYNKNNIFIINESIDLAKIDVFMNTQYQEIDKSIIERYTIANWIKRFGI